MLNFNNVQFEMAVGMLNQLPKSETKEVVFSGHSNVGKSSLINKIFNRKALAKTSSQPGKTRTINFYSVDGIRCIDLPGYGYAKISQFERQKWSKLVEYYFNSNRNIALVIQLLDFRYKASADDFQMLEYLKFRQIPFIIVFTKCDKLKNNKRRVREVEIENELEAFSDMRKVFFSAVTSEGVEGIRSIITDLSL